MEQSESTIGVVLVVVFYIIVIGDIILIILYLTGFDDLLKAWIDSKIRKLREKKTTEEVAKKVEPAKESYKVYRIYYKDDNPFYLTMDIQKFNDVCSNLNNHNIAYKVVIEDVATGKIESYKVNPLDNKHVEKENNK